MVVALQTPTPPVRAQGLEHMLTDAETAVLLLLAQGAPPHLHVGQGAAFSDEELQLACCGNSWPVVAALCCVLRPGNITRVRSAHAYGPAAAEFKVRNLCTCMASHAVLCAACCAADLGYRVSTSWQRACSPCSTAHSDVAPSLTGFCRTVRQDGHVLAEADQTHAFC